MYRFWKPRPPFELVMKSADWDRLHSHLLRADGQERAALGLLGAGPAGRLRQLYVHLLDLSDDDEYVVQHGAFVELSPESVLRSLESYTDSDALGYFYAHSHPFSGHATFSPFDNRHHPKLAASLGRFLVFQGEPETIDDSLFIRMVCGSCPSGFSADVLDAHGKSVGPVNSIKLVGPTGIEVVKPKQGFDHAKARKPSKASERWDRNVAWMGQKGQARLASTPLGIAGAGGAGALALQMALGLGFRDITIIDHDKVELSNLNRLPGLCQDDIGRYKAEALAEEYSCQFPDAHISAVTTKVQASKATEALIQQDVWFAGMDDDEARLSIQTLAARHLKPLIDVGAGFQLDEAGAVKSMGGQVSFYIPGGPCLLCMGLNPSKILPRTSRLAQASVGYVSGTAITPASALTVNASVVSVAMDMLTRYLTGFAATSHFVRLDLLNHQTQAMKFSKREDCPFCGSKGIEGLGQGRTKLRRCARQGVSSKSFVRSLK